MELCFLVDDKHYTYAQLGKITASVAHSLSEIEDERIGIIAENRIETYAAILAVLASGKTYVILHPAYPEERNLKIAGLAGLHTLLCTSHVERPAFGTDLFRVINTDKLSEKAPSELSRLQFYPPEEERNAYIIFTSGSTGEPKGVPITRANLNTFYQAYDSLNWNLDEHDRMLQMFELTFDVSVVSLLYPLTLGASVYTVAHQDVKHFKVFELLEKYELTFATVTPSLLQLLSPYFDEISLPALKYLGVSAEASQTELLERFRKSAPNAEFVNLYGPTVLAQQHGDNPMPVFSFMGNASQLPVHASITTEWWLSENHFPVSASSLLTKKEMICLRERRENFGYPVGK